MHFTSSIVSGFFLHFPSLRSLSISPSSVPWFWNSSNQTSPRSPHYRHTGPFPCHCQSVLTPLLIHPFHFALECSSRLFQPLAPPPKHIRPVTPHLPLPRLLLPWSEAHLSATSAWLERCDCIYVGLFSREVRWPFILIHRCLFLLYSSFPPSERSCFFKKKAVKEKDIRTAVTVKLETAFINWHRKLTTMDSIAFEGFFCSSSPLSILCSWELDIES